jgi:HEAT repeat protein
MSRRFDLIFVAGIMATLGAMLVLGLVWGPEDPHLPKDTPAVRPEILKAPEADPLFPEKAAQRLALFAKGLGEADKASASALADALGSDPANADALETRTLKALALGEKAVPALAAVMRKGSPDAREEAGRLLRDIASPLGTEAMVRGLSDEAFEVQIRCAEALGRIGDRSVILDLLAWKGTTAKRHHGARVAVSRALCALGNRQGLPYLIASLSGSTATSDVYNIRLALDSLRRHTGQNFGLDPHGLRPDREARARDWEDWWEEWGPHMVLKNVSADHTDTARLAWRTAREIETLGGNRYFDMMQAKKILKGAGRLVLPHVLRALYHGLDGRKGTFHVRLGSCHVLGLMAADGMELPSGTQHLAWVLHTDENGAVRAQAAAALGLAGSRRSVSALARTALTDSEISPRIEATISLGRLGSRDALPYLAKLLAQTDILPELRLAARVAQGRINGQSGIEALVLFLGQACESKDFTLAEKAHMGLVEITGRNPLKNRNISIISPAERKKLLLGWQRTAARWALVRGLSEAVAAKDADCARIASEALAQGSGLKARDLPSADEQYRFWEAFRQVWIWIEEMNLALENGETVRFSLLSRRLERFFPHRDGFHPGMNGFYKRKVLQGWQEWAEWADPF